MPLLLVDGGALSESPAIFEFLDETHPPSLLPADPFARAHQRAWGEGASELSQAQWNLLIAATPAARDQASAAFAQIAGRVEAAIDQTIIPRDRFERVHVTLAPSLLRFGIVERGLGITLIDAARWPGLDALARQIGARPSVTSTVADDYAAVLCRRIVDRGSLLAARSGESEQPAACSLKGARSAVRRRSARRGCRPRRSFRRRAPGCDRPFARSETDAR